MLLCDIDKIATRTDLFKFNELNIVAPIASQSHKKLCYFWCEMWDLKI